MPHLFSLDKKLMSIQHKMSLVEINKIMKEHKLSEDNLRGEIQRQLYTKFAESLGKSIPTLIETSETERTYSLRGYVLSERDMYNLIYECLDMDEVGREAMIKEVGVFLGINC